MIKINFNPFGHWLYDFWKQKEKEQTFLDYLALKYFREEKEKEYIRKVCQYVLKYDRLLMQEYHQFTERGIYFFSFTNLSSNEFYENIRGGLVDSDTFLELLSRVCDNKFTKEQIKQTIENERSV